MNPNGMRAWLIRKLGGIVPRGALATGAVSAKRIVHKLAAQSGFYHYEGSGHDYTGQVRTAKLEAAEALAHQAMTGGLIEFDVDRVRESVIVTARMLVLDTREAKQDA